MFLGGLIALVAGILLAIGGGGTAIIDPPAGLTLAVAGAIVAVVGIVNILIAVALFSGKTWGWWFAVVMTAISLIINIVMMNILGALINIIILLYLNTKNTKGWFGV